MNASTAHHAYRLHHSGIELHVAEMPSLMKPMWRGLFYRSMTDPNATILIDVMDILDVVDAPTEHESRNARFICGD